ncbi:hypothetical protein GTZ99_02120 [Novosphingobium sp. FSY-8]|uniref:Cupin domain-containing protein n=1 Tax=Novosphingobium ovatum TaxID=1908523 RepID=A0ABW9X9Z3_9SPHN|nr:hypothetical protein [Novosphingobium ovatum]NBC35349.1 hypothetical protein [Novosphingobium ovatum]
MTQPQETTRRDALGDLGASLAAMLALGAAAPALAATTGATTGAPPPPVPLDFRGSGQMPWFRRVFHLYTGPDGLTRAEQLPTNAPLSGEIAMFLRRKAERVSIGGSAPNSGFDFHVANQPTLLIPILGRMIIGLADGTTHDLVHGDIAYAEDCTGKGHISKSGPEGSFMVSVQLPKPLCPAVGSSDRAKLWTD